MEFYRLEPAAANANITTEPQNQQIDQEICGFPSLTCLASQTIGRTTNDAPICLEGAIVSLQIYLKPLDFVMSAFPSKDGMETSCKSKSLIKQIRLDNNEVSVEAALNVIKCVRKIQTIFIELKNEFSKLYGVVLCQHAHIELNYWENLYKKVLDLNARILASKIYSCITQGPFSALSRNGLDAVDFPLQIEADRILQVGIQVGNFNIFSYSLDTLKI